MRIGPLVITVDRRHRHDDGPAENRRAVYHQPMASTEPPFPLPPGTTF